jgi:hypothetical protein
MLNTIAKTTEDELAISEIAVAYWKKENPRGTMVRAWKLRRDELKKKLEEENRREPDI